MVQVSPFFETSFGKFVPSDRPTYRKLKRIRRLAAFAEAMASRWSRAQRRLPKNRFFRRGRSRRLATDAMLFIPFWQPRASPDAADRTVRFVAAETPLLRVFLEDHRSARHPVDVPASVVPLKLAPDELDALLAALEAWHEEVFLPW